MTDNGHVNRIPRVVNFRDPAVIARLAIDAFLHGDDEARETIERERPDIDIGQLELSMECAAMVFAHLLSLDRINAVFHGKAPR